MREAPTDEDEKGTKGKDDWRWIDENVKLSRLNVISLAKDANGKREPRTLTKEGNIQGDFDWSPDGKTIVFTRTKMPKADYWPTSDLFAVDVASGAVKTVVATNASESNPSFSPDGKWLSFIVSDDPPRWAGYQRIAVMPANGSAPPRLLAETFDVQPGVIDWSADGRKIYFGETRGTVSRVAAFDVSTGAIAELNKGNEVLSGISLNAAGTMLGFTMQANDKAPEAFVTSTQSFAPVQVSRANADLPKLPAGKTEVIKWKSSDGQEIEGLLTYPVDYKAGTRVPLLLVIHGGPAGVFTQTFLAGRGVYPIASFASRGYAVLRPNPRGSSGYGQKFRFANIKDWGGGDYQDLMTGVDHVVSMGVADPERLGVMGWSYGGFMTSWVITQTKRFKAASVGAAVTNLMSFIGTADIPSFIPDYFGGQPWENLEIYRTHSAMFNAKGVTTPTLIQHGEADERVPISQGYEFYNALKVQNVPVRMIAFPRMPHGLNEPKMVLKGKQTNLEWFDKYLRAGGATPATASN
jgi:dipeptidyl aminopeptidase/acylaminoacyl peptidase